MWLLVHVGKIKKVFISIIIIIYTHSYTYTQTNGVHSSESRFTNDYTYLFLYFNKMKCTQANLLLSFFAWSAIAHSGAISLTTLIYSLLIISFYKASPVQGIRRLLYGLGNIRVER